jgi:predicted Rossmann-fold nucleotide-binding protein
LVIFGYFWLSLVIFVLAIALTSCFVHRLKADNPHFVRSRALGKMVSELLGTPAWTGGGPGMMEAASLGAMDAGKPVAGIRIEREAGTKVRSAAQSYLKPEHAVFCKFLSPRKVALVDAGVRKSANDRTAYVFLPGGLGTMDELFELFTLYQLHKLGTDFPVPVIIGAFLFIFIWAISMTACFVNSQLRRFLRLPPRLRQHHARTRYGGRG